MTISLKLTNALDSIKDLGIIFYNIKMFKKKTITFAKCIDIATENQII